MAGKTGTAQRANPACSCYAGGGYVTTFVGFAPADDPQYVVAVNLERPSSDAEGGQVAAPVFADIMKYALTAHGVVPSGTPRPDFVLDGPLTPARAGPRQAAAAVGACGARGARPRHRPPVDWSPVTPTDAGSVPRLPGNRPLLLADLGRSRRRPRRGGADGRRADPRRDARLRPRSPPATSTRRCPARARTASSTSHDAVARGAVAVLTDPTGRDAALATGLPVCVVDDPRAVLGAVADRVYGEPQPPAAPSSASPAPTARRRPPTWSRRGSPPPAAAPA